MSIKCVHQASHNEQQSILLVALDNVNSLLALSDAQSSCKVLLLSLSSCSSLAAKRSCKRLLAQHPKMDALNPLVLSDPLSKNLVLLRMMFYVQEPRDEDA